MSIARNAFRRRLLVITYHFPPDGTIGGQRWAGLSKYLARRGWEVHVLTASADRGETLPPGVTRHFRPRHRTLNDLYRERIARRLVPRSVGVAEQPNSQPAWSGSVSRIFGLLRRLVGSAMVLPDHGRGWVTGAAVAASALLRDDDFDCVITSGPPHSAHFAGWTAACGRRANFWIDMRDPWALTYEMNTPEDGFIRGERRFLRLLERLVFPRASRVLVNTREFASALRLEMPQLNVMHFPNGIDMEQLPPRDLSSVEKGSIAYVGTLYAGRNLSSVLAAMRCIVNERPDTADALKLNVAGPLESPHRERMHAEIQDAGLSSLVSVLGLLPRDGALQLLSRAHLALVLAQDQPLCVPAKLYESVGMGVPTLVIAEKDSAAAHEARRIGAMTVEGEDEQGIKAVLTDMLAGRIPVRIAPKTAISYEELAGEMDQLLRESAPQRHSRLRVGRESLPHLA
jgi:glycosyltransferase involved in cell wall biosynthesis